MESKYNSKCETNKMITEPTISCIHPLIQNLPFLSFLLPPASLLFFPYTVKLQRTESHHRRTDVLLLKQNLPLKTGSENREKKREKENRESF